MVTKVWVSALLLLTICIISSQVDARRAQRRSLSTSQRVDLSLYHTTDEIYEEFESLAEICPYLTVGWHEGETRSLMHVTINKDPAKEKIKSLIYFGEHARELISPETGLEVAKSLCKQNSEGYEADEATVDKLLEHSEFKLFPVINPTGRKLAESGKYCQRTNQEGVDLNRNWGDHWQWMQKSGAGNTYAGDHAFSEEETQILKADVEEYQPTAFLTVHSGFLSMMTPYAYGKEEPSAPGVEQDMMSLLETTNAKYCNCDAGSAGSSLGYLCPGTCLDYIYDKFKPRYSLAIEIYDGSDGDGYRRSAPSPSLFEGIATRNSMYSHSEFTLPVNYTLERQAVAMARENVFLSVGESIQSSNRAQIKAHIQSRRMKDPVFDEMMKVLEDGSGDVSKQSIRRRDHAMLARVMKEGGLFASRASNGASSTTPLSSNDQAIIDGSSYLLDSAAVADSEVAALDFVNAQDELEQQEAADESRAFLSFSDNIIRHKGKTTALSMAEKIATRKRLNILQPPDTNDAETCECLTHFNPSTPDKYEKTVQNWNNGILDMFSTIVDREMERKEETGHF